MFFVLKNLKKMGSTAGAKLNSGGGVQVQGVVLPDSDDITAPPELFECFEDARSVAKSFFGSPNIKNAVLVVPNDYNYKVYEQSIKEAANRALIHILDIIPEHIAVAAAYADKTRPTDRDLPKITIISSTSGTCDVYVVSMSVALGMGYRYKVESRGSHGQEAGHDEEKISIGKIDIVPPSCSKAPPSLGVMAENNLIFTSETPGFEKKHGLEKVQGFEKVVFVGKSAELLNMRKIINKGFTLIKEWKDTDQDSDQLATYGAAKLASFGKHVAMSKAPGRSTRRLYCARSNIGFDMN